MIFNWKITAVPSWICLLCLLVVYNRAVIKISQAALLAPSHFPLSCRCHGGERGDRAWAEAASQNVQNRFWLLKNFSQYYFRMLVWIILPNEHFFHVLWNSLRFVWIRNFIQHLLHHFVPDFFLLTPCPVYLTLNNALYFQGCRSVCVYQWRS